MRNYISQFTAAKYVFPFLVFFVFAGVSCGQPSDGGVFRSVDGGEVWEQKNYAGTNGRRALSLGNVSLLDIEQHPEDPNTIFVGTEGNGIYFTINGGEEWFQLKSVGAGVVRDITIDSKDPNIMYAAVNATIIKSEDGGDTWTRVYTDVKNQSINKIVVDNVNNNYLYAATASGSVVKSRDFGITWDLVLSNVDPIIELLLDRSQPNVLFALDDHERLFRTTTYGEPATNDVELEDSGWVELTDDLLESEYGVRKVFDVAMDVNNNATVYIASLRGIQVSRDRGETWSDIQTLFGFEDKRNESIRHMQVLPGDSNTLYFTNGTAIHKSTDGGANWKVISTLRTSRRVTDYVIDYESPQLQYVSTQPVEQKKGLIR